MNLIKSRKEKKCETEDVYYRTKEYTYNFQDFQTINTFARDIYNGAITIKEVGKAQSDLFVKI